MIGKPFGIVSDLGLLARSPTQGNSELQKFIARITLRFSITLLKHCSNAPRYALLPSELKIVANATNCLIHLTPNFLSARHN
jgi:hypothetical protein